MLFQYSVLLHKLINSNHVILDKNRTAFEYLFLCGYILCINPKTGISIQFSCYDCSNPKTGNDIDEDEL